MKVIWYGHPKLSYKALKHAKLKGFKKALKSHSTQ